MKTLRLYKLLLIAVFGVLFARFAAASDGRITFNGKITGNTCAVKLNDASASSTLTLPTISSTNLANVSATAATTQFDIHLTGCNIIDSATNLTTYFEHGQTVNPAGRLSNDSGDATGVDIQLLNADGDVIDLSKEASAQGDKKVAMPTGTDQIAILTYYAQYYRAGAIGPGTVITHVDYTVVYD